MTWHLKDRELEKVFEAYSGGKFVKSLNYAVEQEIIDSECVVYVGFGREFLGPDFAENCLCFRTDELEEVHEYNPNDWNDYQKVTPPEGVWMRVETTRKVGAKAMFKNGYWVEPDGHYFVTGGGRFRPWED